MFQFIHVCVLTFISLRDIWIQRDEIRELTCERDERQTTRRMVVRTDGRTDGRAGGRTDVRTVAGGHVRSDGRTVGRTDGRSDGPTYERSDGRRVGLGRTDGRTNGWTVEYGRTNESSTEQTSARSRGRLNERLLASKATQTYSLLTQVCVASALLVGLAILGLL